MTLAVVAVLAVAGTIWLTKALDSASYAVLYRGLASSEGVEVVNMLSSAGVDYRLESDGTILVPKAMRRGYACSWPPAGFRQHARIRHIRKPIRPDDDGLRKAAVPRLPAADRLQEALKTLNGVRNAIVTLNVAQEDSYVLKSDRAESTAAVVLDLYAYAELDARQIRGVEELVAKSVPA